MKYNLNQQVTFVAKSDIPWLKKYYNKPALIIAIHEDIRDYQDRVSYGILFEDEEKFLAGEDDIEVRSQGG